MGNWQYLCSQCSTQDSQLVQVVKVQHQKQVVEARQSLLRQPKNHGASNEQQQTPNVAELVQSSAIKPISQIYPDVEDFHSKSTIMEIQKQKVLYHRTQSYVLDQKIQLPQRPDFVKSSFMKKSYEQVTTSLNSLQISNKDLMATQIKEVQRSQIKDVQGSQIKDAQASQIKEEAGIQSKETIPTKVSQIKSIKSSGMKLQSIITINEKQGVNMPVNSVKKSQI